MPKKEIEGEWIHGWPDRKRPSPEVFKDAEGRVVSARTPVLELEGLITPTDAIHIVAQLQMPEPVHPEDYSFSLFGEVDAPLDYSLDQIRALPGRTVRAVNECAGNDADFFDCLKDGGTRGKPSLAVSEEERAHWKHGEATRREANPDTEALFAAIPSTCHVSGGEWTGTPLAEALKLAGVKPGAVAVRLEGWDEGRPDPTTVYRSAMRSDFEVFDPGVINYDKGLPLAKALHPDTILAWAHNGECLRHVHGAPLRLVVPGWAGNWWVKWIHKIEVMDHMPDCYHQTPLLSGKIWELLENGPLFEWVMVESQLQDSDLDRHFKNGPDDDCKPFPTDHKEPSSTPDRQPCCSAW